MTTKVITAGENERYWRVDWVRDNINIHGRLGEAQGRGGEQTRLERSLGQ